MSRLLIGLIGICVVAAPAWAGPPDTIDGTAGPAYGPALSIQNTQTNFGDSNLGVVDFANGSELDTAFGYVYYSDELYLTLAGNLESNFNKLEIFIDSIPSQGQNKLRGDNPDVDFDGLNRMGDDGSGNGLTFDAGFEADFYLSFTGGNDPYQLFGNYAELLTKGGGEGYYLGQGGAVTDGTLSGGNNPFGILATINNSNTAGVTSGTGPDSGEGVTTGLELLIPLEAIGNPSANFRVVAFVNGSSHDFLSNQVLGGIGGGDNLGEPRNVNFDGIDGEQFFTVPICSCLGDIDGDGFVTFADLVTFLECLDTGGGVGCGCGDFDRDAAVTFADLVLFLEALDTGNCG